MHRMLMPGVPRVDHWDHDGLNNQRYNLRPASHAQNIANSRKRVNNRSPFKGVRFRVDKESWQARLGQQHLGYFVTAKEAAAAYDRAAIQKYGEFATLNLN